MPLSTSLQRKVPQVTILFWVIKILTTAFGEAASDYLVSVIDPIVAVGLGGIALVGALVLQFRARRYVAWIYWLTVAMVAVFGTMAADVLHVGLGIPYIVTTIFFLAVLGVVFVAWFKTEKTLSIHSIYTPRREAFYWATVLSTFALGTAAGDLTAVTFHLGYLGSGLLFAGIILIPALAYWKLHLSEISAFWFAYILTRPLGASFADWAGKSHAIGGLGMGDGSVGLILGTAIIALVGYLQIRRADTESPEPSESR